MRIVNALAMLAALASPAVAAPPDPLLGDWLTEDGKGLITVAPCGDALCGAITGVSEFPPGGLKDVHGAPECQLRIIKDMRPQDDGRRHGSVTNPQDGQTYHAELWLGDDGRLNLRGYLGLPLFGSTRTWSRFAGTRTPDCHFSTR